jgi:hypothetical protein
MSRQLKRQLGRANGGRGAIASSAPPAPARSLAKPRLSRQQRLNRILLIGGAALAASAVVVALLAPRFDPLKLAVNLGAIGLGLVMGKGIGLFMFRRVLPDPKK